MNFRTLVGHCACGNEGYRQRCHYEVARLQRLFESESKTHTRGNRMAEPTYDELKARVAELEKQKRTGVAV
jgi:hypothetical protein